MRESMINKTPLVRRPFSTDTLGTLFASLLATVLSLPSSILIARFLGPDGKGVVTLVLLVTGQITAFLSLGIEIAIIFYGGRLRWEIKELGNASIGLGILLGGTGILAGIAIFTLVLPKFLPGNLSLILILMCLTIPMALTTNFLRSLIRVTGRIIEEGCLGVIAVLLNLILISMALIAGFGLKGVFVAFWLGSILLTLLVLWFGGYLNFFEIRTGFAFPLWKPLIRYGIKLHIGSIFQSLNYRFDMYLVGFFLGAASVGWYSVSVGIAEWLWLVPSVLGTALMQRVATTQNQVNEIIGPINRLTSGVLFVGILLLGCLGKWIIRLLYGGAFAPSFLPFLLLLPGIWAMGLWKNFMNDLSVRGYPVSKTYTSGIALILTLGLDILLIPRWGLNGAALASSIAYISAFLITLGYYCKITGFYPLDLLIIRWKDMVQLKTVVRNGLQYLFV